MKIISTIRFLYLKPGCKFIYCYYYKYRGHCPNRPNKKGRGWNPSPTKQYISQTRKGYFLRPPVINQTSIHKHNTSPSPVILRSRATKNLQTCYIIAAGNKSDSQTHSVFLKINNIPMHITIPINRTKGTHYECLLCIMFHVEQKNIPLV